MAETGLVGSAFIDLRYRLNRLNADFAKAQAAIGKQAAEAEGTFSRAFGKIGGVIAAPFRQLGGIMSSVEGKVGAIAGVLGGLSLGSGIIRANVEFERLSGALKTVTGSAEAGKKAFDELTAFAAKMPYDVNQAVESFITLRARGLNPTIEMLNSFGNTASAMGKSLGQFGEAVADAATGQFERLLEFGIKASAQGEKVAFTFGDVTTTVGKNAQEIVGYLENIGNTKFAGGMEEQANRLPGLFSAISEGVNKFAIDIGQGGLNDGLRALAKVFIDVQAEGMPLANTLGQVLGGALTKLAGALRSALDWFNALPPEMQEFTIKAGALATAIAAAAPVLAIFVASVAALASPIGLAVVAVAGLGAAYITFKDQVDAAVSAAGQRLSAFWQQQVADLQGVTAALGPAGERLSPFWRQQVADLNLAAEQLAAAGGRIKAFWAQQLADFQAFAEGMKAAGERVSSFWAQQKKELADFASNPVEALKTAAADVKAQVSAMFGGVEQEAQKLDATVAKVQESTAAISEAFKGTYVDVVGQSYWPDTVDEVGAHTARLNAEMVRPVELMTGQVNDAFKGLGQDVGRSMGGIPAPRAPVPAVNPTFDTSALYSPLAGAGAAFQRYSQEAAEHGRIAGEFVYSGLQRAQDGLAEFLTDGEFTFKKLGDAAEDFGKRMLDMLADIAAQQILAGVIGGIGSMFGPGAAATGPRTGPGGLIVGPNAKGGVYSGKGISAFSGSIVKSPTLFPFAKGIGLMGESGPEAILPLRRGKGGRLGVEMADGGVRGGGGMVVNVIDQRGAGAPPVERRERTGPDGVRQVDLIVREATQKGLAQGRHDDLLGQRFGMRPVPVR